MNFQRMYKIQFKDFLSDIYEDNIENRKFVALFILVTIPIFFSVSIENLMMQCNSTGGSEVGGAQILGKGIFLNANAFLSYKFPALPISFFLIVYLSISLLPQLLKRKTLYVIAIIAFPSLLLVYLYGENFIAPFKIFMQVMIFFITVEIFRTLIPANYKKSNLIKNIYFSLLLLCGIKFVFDITLSWQLISTWFVFRSIQIYNFYDYFPMVYFLLIYFSYSAIKYQKSLIGKMISWVAIILSFVFILMTYSRIYQALLIITPLLFITKRLDEKIEGPLFNVVVILLVSFSIGYLYMMYSSLDFLSSMQNERSMLTRSSIIGIFFDNLNRNDVFFPSISEARNIFSLKGRSLHSEHLEIYSCLGLPFVLFFYFYLSKQIKDVFWVDRYMGIVFLSILFLGGAIQSNFLQTHSGILLGALLGSFLKIYDNNQGTKKECSQNWISEP